MDMAYEADQRYAGSIQSVAFSDAMTGSVLLRGNVSLRLQLMSSYPAMDAFSRYPTVRNAATGSVFGVMSDVVSPLVGV